MNASNKFQELFEDLIGQPAAVSILSSALNKQRINNAYLFNGPNGVGRKLAALRFLEGVITGGLPSLRERRRLKSKNHPDLLWVEPTYLKEGQLIPKSIAEKELMGKRNYPKIRLEQIREVTRFLSRKPIESGRGMVVIEEVDEMAEMAANALLKTLEEPGNGFIILLSARSDCLLPTIQSRCQQIPFLRLRCDDLYTVMDHIRSENTNTIPHEFNEEELTYLASGSPGALIHHRKIKQEIPDDLWPRLENLPTKPIDALSLARDLTQSLNGEQQLWVINWLQHNLWRESLNPIHLKRLEKLRNQLLGFVQPRLAWEVALLEMISK